MTTPSAKLDWEQIDVVLLDMDGTILDLHFDNYFWGKYLAERYAKIHAIPFNLALADLEQRFSQNRGTLDWYCIDFWSQQLNVDILKLKHEVANLIAILPGSEKFLATVAQHKAVFLVTNAHPDTLALKLQQTNISGFFQQLISSHQLGYPKEQPDFWPCLQRKIDFLPERALLVEDNLAILRTARAFGIKELFLITRPDSQKPEQLPEDFIGIQNLAELLTTFPIAH